MEMVLKKHAKIDSYTQSWVSYHMKRKKNTGSQMGHNNKIFLRIKYIFLQSILLKHEFIYCYMIVIVLLEIRPNDLHRVKPHFWLKFILEPFAEFSSTIKSKPGLESLMLSRQLVSLSWREIYIFFSFPPSLHYTDTVFSIIVFMNFLIMWYVS